MTTANAQVLVLNRGYQPVAVTGVERAFGLLYSGAAQALDSQYQTFDYESWSALSADHGDDIINTVKTALKVPRVLVLQAFSRLPRSKIRFSRQNVYLRDDFTCQYCAKEFTRSKLNLDHVNPRAQGGKTRWENIVCSCIECNLKKGGRTPSQAGMKLLREPKRPMWTGVVPRRGKIPYKEWVPFIDTASAAYWNTELEDD